MSYINKVDIIILQLINADMDQKPISGPRYPSCPISTGGSVYVAGQGNEVYLHLLHRQAQNEGHPRGISDVKGRAPPRACKSRSPAR